MRTLYLDCFSGISGDMMVGALCDLGVDFSLLEKAVAQLGVGAHLHIGRQTRCGIEGVKFDVHEAGHHHHHHDHGHTHDHGHAHDHGHTHGRTHAEIRVLLAGSDLSAGVKKRALAIFQRIAVAEGKIHGIAPEEVGFHEIGAVDSIADVVCACAGMEALGVERVLASPLRDGRGFAKMAHGTFPIPAPATVEILAGIALEQIDEPHEMITPTGAAIVAEFAESFGLMPAMRIERVGYGVGQRDHPHRPNVLRAILGETEAAGAEADLVARIETNLDDLSPEITATVIERLLVAGALDAFLTPVQMKKNRPGVLLTALCETEAVDRLADLIFRETTSFGVRIDDVRRLKLDRRFETVATPFGEVVLKIGTRGSEVLQAAPEFESCRAAAEAAGVPLRVVFDAARHAWMERR